VQSLLLETIKLCLGEWNHPIAPHAKYRPESGFAWGLPS